MFGFDEQYAMFDVTPLDNQFILEEMPGAKGDYVKVYLYGLLHCYHPQADMSLSSMAQELSMTEEEVMQAYRYWERRMLVRRVSDRPPVWQYINVQQRALLQSTMPVDAKYADFCEALQAQFGNDRELTGREMSMAYEWVEELLLPVEVVLMFVQHWIRMQGKKFTFSAAAKRAARLAEDNIRTVEDAEDEFSRDEAVDKECRALLRHLGQNRKPTKDESNMYVRWTQEWGYTLDSIIEACAKTTHSLTPNFAYLDSILRGMRGRVGQAMATRTDVKQAIKAENDRTAPYKELMHALNHPGLSVNDGALSIYDDMRAMYDHEVIMLAARECTRCSKNTLEDVMTLLESWRRRNLRTAGEVRVYLETVKQQDRIIAALFEFWGVKKGIQQNDRRLLDKWQKEYGYSEMMIMYCAAYAQNKDKPMLYLDKILADFVQKGVNTPDAAEAAHQAFAASQAAQPAPQRPAKVVREQQYAQREYKPAAGMTDRMAQRLKELNNDAK